MATYDKPPLPPTSKIDRGYPEGADNGLDTLRSHNVKKFQKDTYAGLTEHLAVVLRVESDPKADRGGKNISRHSLFSATVAADATTHVVRARIVSSNVHEYMPKPIDPQDHQIIDLYPAFEISREWKNETPKTNQLIRVQFYDREISSKRNLNGQILSIETSEQGSSYSQRLAWSQAPAPAFAGTGGSGAPQIPPADLKDISAGSVNGDEKGVVSTTDVDGVVIEKEIKPRWPLAIKPATKRGQGGGHRGIDMRTGQKNGVPVLATLDGIVERVYFQTPNAEGRSGGCTVMVHHPKAINPEDGTQGLYSSYMHLSKYLAAEGQHVKRNQVLGWSGGGSYNAMRANPANPPPAPKKGGELPDRATVLKYTGGSTGPHLHFEVKNRTNGRHSQINILKFLQGTIVQKA